MTTDLVSRTTVRELVLAFASAEQEIRAAFAAIVAAEARVNAVFTLGEESYKSIRVSACGSRYHDRFDDPDETIGLMTRAAWRTIVDRLELRRFMSIKAYDQMTKALDTEKLPPITEENVLRFAHDHLARARSYLRDAVGEVFEWLRPRKGTQTGDLKTNSELEVPSKVILGYVVERGWSSGFRVNYTRRQHLVALENVFNAIAGNGEICKGYQSLLETAIETAKDGEGETELFRFRCCLNGNLHLTFKRLDLLDRFNMLAGGKTLRPAQTEEERLRVEIAKARAENERLKRSKAA
jgi:hypothetical protein